MHSAAVRTTWPARLLTWLGRRRATRTPTPASFALGTPDASGHVEMLLSQMRAGEQGHILSLCTCCAARQHLLELGFTPGTVIEFVRRAPLGDPLTVRVRGYQLSLRQSEAEAVRVRRCPPDWDGDLE